MNIPKEIFDKYPDYIDTLLNCVIASRVVYEDDAITALKSSPYSNLAHSISKLCVSQFFNRTKNLKFINSLNDIRYLVSDLGSKRTLVAFRGSQTRDDFLTDAYIHSASSVYTGQIHSGFYNRAECVPINYFVKKLTEGYQLVFTGHSLGAAISCLLAIKLIENTKIGREIDSNKILFIGFGCPLIADQAFKNHINSKHKLNFHFIKNEQDIIVKSLDYLSNKIHNNNNNNNESMVINQSEENTNSLFSKLQKGWQLAKPILQTFIPKYEQFGVSLQLDKNGLSQVECITNETNIDLTSLNGLMSQARNHFMNNYFTNLNSNYFTSFKCKNNSICFEFIKDLHLSEKEAYFVRIVKRLNITEISICFKHLENKENILFGKLMLNGVEAYVENDPLKDNLNFKFNLESDACEQNGKFVNQGDLVIVGHFNSVCYLINFSDAKVEESVVLQTKSTGDKRLETAAKALSIGLRFLSKK